MTKIALIYGSIAGVVIIASMITGFTLSDGEGFGSSQWLGYLIMIVAFTVIFIGIKRFRDQELGGVIKFGKAFTVGLAISIVACIAYVISWEIYLALTDYAFVEQYTEGMIRLLEEKGMTGAELEAKTAEITASMENYGNPLYRIPMTFFIEPLPVALVITLISAAILRNPKAFPARG